MVDGARAIETKEKNDENVVMPGMGQRWFYVSKDDVLSLSSVLILLGYFWFSLWF